MLVGRARKEFDAMRYRVLMVALGLLWLGPAAALAQTEASVTGAAVDETKAVLPGVTITATDLANGRMFTAVTDARGEYRLPSMPAGRYKFQAELAGFATMLVPEVELLVGQKRAVGFSMTVARVAETLTVTGEAPLVDTRTSQVAGNVDRRQMEELPISGRNWIELAMLVKGVTANDVGEGRPGTFRDGEFRINLDGQEITQAVSATVAFGQPGLSREAIAEYQVVTNMFDIAQGRSVGLQVQAITRSGTNDFDGTAYGYFRDSKFNAADFVAKRVLPYQNQQVGFSIGGPIMRDKLQFFGTYEYERQPSTFNVTPPSYVNSITFSNTQTHHRELVRGDYQFGSKDHLSARFTRYDNFDPFGALGGAGSYVAANFHPTYASKLGRDNHATSVTWSRVLSPSLVQEVKGGWFHYHWNHVPAVGVPLTPQFAFPGYAVGARANYPEEFWQNTPSIRYDLSWHKGAHDFKIGGEFLKWRDTGWWQLRTRGQYIFSQLPADIERRFPLDAWDDPSKWDLTGLDLIALRFDRFFAEEGGGFVGNCPNPDGCGNWSLDIPRPTYGVWIGDTWAVNNQLTLNLGLRYDLDWGVLAPPFVKPTDVFISNGIDTNLNVGYRTDLRDLNNIAPRVGFSYNINGTGDMVIRGGTGIFYAVPNSELPFLYQLFNGQRVLTNSWPNDGRPGFVSLDPETGAQRGVSGEDFLSGAAPLAAQSPYVIAHDLVLPSTWQSVIGFQKQIGQVMAVDADLTYFRGRNYGRGRDPNLFYDPVTGFNRHPRNGRPNPSFTQFNYYESNGRADNLSLATGFTRRFRNNFQYGLTYTLMFFRNDTGTGTQAFGGTSNNPFDISLDQEWARAQDFQRSTFRGNGIYQFPLDITFAATYFYGSGAYFPTRFGGDPLGANTGVNRTRNDLTVVPRNTLKGESIHKLDLRVSKEFTLFGDVRITGNAELFNVFNHANYGNYQILVNTTTFGNPVQNSATTYSPRSAQFGFKLTF
jgi:Carboxypeptidase regulatory-like domain